MGFWLLLACMALVWLYLKLRQERKTNVVLRQRGDEREALIQQLERDKSELKGELDGLGKYRGIVDAEVHVQQILAEAKNTLDDARQRAMSAKQDANDVLEAARGRASQHLEEAGVEAAKVIEAAKKRAEEIAGDAYVAMNRAKEFEAAATAIKNIIEGYGDQYIQPTYSLLDDLADEFGFTEAGQKLKAARDATRTLMQIQRAATCEYAEPVRRATAIRFVCDAFNGKVDSILTRSKADNFGKLEQEIRDAYAVVNLNGAAFRNARITEEFLQARLDELRWAATAHAIKDKEREEQRALRDQMREEEKARREFERAIKDAAKEEEAIKKAMERVQKQVAEANDMQRAELEARLHELEEKLKAAEEKNQRALSMAQQTRTGHVYVISNIGSFGEQVFKIGMTRRLEPKDRIRELGDASVPFEFDIHAMIFSEDAPGLEKALHRHFLRQQLNKVNPRKEFFRIDLSSIRQELEKLGIETHWTMKAAAEEYRATLQIEQQIRENPTIEQQWTKHQLEYEPVLEGEVAE